MTTKGSVIGVISNIVTIQVDGPVSQNEICYITVNGDRLMAEVIKVVGQNAHARGDFGTGYALQEVRRSAKRPGKNGGCIPEKRTIYLPS